MPPAISSSHFSMQAFRKSTPSTRTRNALRVSLYIQTAAPTRRTHTQRHFITPNAKEELNVTRTSSVIYPRCSATSKRFPIRMCIITLNRHTRRTHTRHCSTFIIEGSSAWAYSGPNSSVFPQTEPVEPGRVYTHSAGERAPLCLLRPSLYLIPGNLRLRTP